MLVTAHLDRTAASSPNYQEITDPAPGADDDASGIAAVVGIAERLVALALRQKLQKTIRFVLFNAEEEGLVGSQAYARLQKSLGTPIVGVFQMDMIGYNRDPPRTWEVHAGFAGSASVESKSVACGSSSPQFMFASRSNLTQSTDLLHRHFARWRPSSRPERSWSVSLTGVSSMLLV